MKLRALALLTVVILATIPACVNEKDTPKILVPPLGPHDCPRGYDHCVEGDPTSPSGLRQTGFCCPSGNACGGGFPNVGCAPGKCCPTMSGGLSGGLDAARPPTDQVREGTSP